MNNKNIFLKNINNYLKDLIVDLHYGTIVGSGNFDVSNNGVSVAGIKVPNGSIDSVLRQLDKGKKTVWFRTPETNSEFSKSYSCIKKGNEPLYEVRCIEYDFSHFN